jgi:PAS domain S-box-containing protein
MHRMALERVPFALVITNPHLDDNPIVFVNQAFTRLTGYAAEVSVGRNCRFLQGVDTDPAAIQALRDGIKRCDEFSVELLNYKADGTPFLNRIFISPLTGEDGDVEFFVGIQRASGVRAGGVSEELDEALREIHHRVKNHLSMVVGMIRMQARAENASSVENYATLARRIETLQFLYQEMTTGGTRAASERDIALGAYVSRIASAIAYLDGRESVRLNLDLANVRAPIDAAAQVGLVVSELLTNAYQHAFRERHEGLIEVRLMELSGGVVRLQVSDDGIGIPEGVRWPDAGNLGGKIVRSLLTGLGARLDVTSGVSGTIFTVDVPASSFVESEAEPMNGRPREIAGPHGAQIGHDERASDQVGST